MLFFFVLMLDLTMWPWTALLPEKALPDRHNSCNSTWKADPDANSKSYVSVGSARSATSVVGVSIVATTVAIAISAIIVAVAALALDLSSLLQLRM